MFKAREVLSFLRQGKVFPTSFQRLDRTKPEHRNMSKLHVNVQESRKYSVWMP